MLNCPYSTTCCKFICDFACKEFSEYEHWMNRCDLFQSNPAEFSTSKEIQQASFKLNEVLHDSSTQNKLAIQSSNPIKDADLISYLIICEYCRNIGMYNGIYKLNFSQYLDEIKNSWSYKNNSQRLDDIKLWIRTSKYLVIYNLGLIRFGDFESQTMLSIFQERYARDKITLIILDEGKNCITGKFDSIFFNKLKSEFKSMGVRL